MAKPILIIRAEKGVLTHKNRAEIEDYLKNEYFVLMVENKERMGVDFEVLNAENLEALQAEELIEKVLKLIEIKEDGSK